MKNPRTLSLLGVLCIAGLLLSGCYSTRVSTPKEPNGQKIEKDFATGFLYGLATPGARFYAERCTHGVARLESKYSFLNMVASNLTFGLYTPMSVEVWCAQESPQQASVFFPETFAPEKENDPEKAKKPASEATASEK